MTFNTQGPSSSQAAYLLAQQPNIRIVAIITTGDPAPGGAASGFVGSPDGLGAFSNGDGTATILVNHELSSAAGVTRAHGLAGAFVDRIVVNTSTLAVTSLTDLATGLFDWNYPSTQYVASTVPVGRLCSADLADTAAYFNLATGLGTTDRILLNGEEIGPEGRPLAWIASGAEVGRVYELPRLGNASYENLVARPFASDQTVIIGMDDATGGQVYVYIGQKTASGGVLDKAGLSNGMLYGIKASFAAETNAGPISGSFTLAALGDVSALSGAQIEAASNTAGVTRFLRPEDGAWDTLNPNRFYFQTTNSISGPSRLWALDFLDPTDPTKGGSITALLDGSEGQRMLDNITVTAPGSYLPAGTTLNLEDTGGNARASRVWSYDPASDQLALIAKHNPALFGDDGASATAPFTVDEETSGVLDVTSLFGNADTNAYLITSQAHYGNANPALVEGGQLAIIYVDRPMNGGAGDDDVRGGWFAEALSGGAGNDLVRGGDGDDTLYGGTGNDSLVGAQGNDLLRGEAGEDIMTGGLGDDVYVVDAAGDVVVENAGEGTDTAFVIADYVAGPFGRNVEVIRVFNGASVFIGSASDEQIVCNAGMASNIAGGGGADVLWGSRFNNTMDGGAGDDIIRSQGGGGIFTGGEGNDHFVVSHLDTTLVEGGGTNSGTDTAWVAVNGWTNFANVEIVRMAAPGVVMLTGAGTAEDLVANQAEASRIDARGGNDVLWGSAFADTLNGEAGDDIMRGQGGADVMAGGEGDDQYVVFSSDATITEAANAGYDIVYFAGNGAFIMGENVEEGRLVANGSGLVGNALPNLLVANNNVFPSFASRIEAGAGDDTIWGTSSATGDTLIGGAGNDLVYAQLGADRFLYNAPDWGYDGIVGFHTGQAKIQFTADSGVTRFSQLFLNSAGGNTQIEFNGQAILVFGVASLAESDFIFG